MQTIWTCECNKWKLVPIREGIFWTHAWNLAHAWIRLGVPFCDGDSYLGQAQAWGEVAHLIIQGHHESGRLSHVGRGEKFGFKKENKFLHKKARHEGEWNWRQNTSKRENPKQFQGLGFKPKGNFVKKGVPLNEANLRGMLVRSPKEHASITMKWDITPKIAPNPNQGMEALK